MADPETPIGEAFASQDLFIEFASYLIYEDIVALYVSSLDPCLSKLCRERTLQLHDALIGASTRDEVDEVVRLVDAVKVDPSVVGSSITTPLWAASSRGHSKIVEILLEAGCAVNWQDDEGRTALEVALEQQGKPDLLERGSELDDEEADVDGTIRLLQHAGGRVLSRQGNHDDDDDCYN